ncbi:hypothetical protein OAH18_03630, partial [bacterium]|nr:hypothetical protein [bacterium]
RLSATTDDFELNSEVDNNRQLAKLSLDLPALVPVIPGGTFSLSSGPLSMDVTTVSYKLEPQLNVTQDVAASYKAVENGMKYSFFRSDDGTSIQTDVEVNGVLNTGVTEIQFSQGDNVRVKGVNYDGVAGNDPIVVQPTMDVKAEFRNDIGLEIDLDGVFSAFGISLAAFGVDIVDVAPLLKHSHNLGRAQLGDVFNKTFDLPTRSVNLESFTLFNQENTGRTAATALMLSATGDNPDVAEHFVDSVRTGPPVTFFSSELVNMDRPDTYFQTLDVNVSGSKVTVEKLEVLDDRLSITDHGQGAVTIDGFTEDMIRERSSGVFALTFSSGEGNPATITTTRRNPTSITAIEGQTAGVDENAFAKVGVKGALNNDIDDNGVVDPETDGVLVLRHLAGMTGQSLVSGALGENANRTEPADIADYIRRLRNAEYLDADGNVFESLDIDGDNGTASALGDGILLARYMAGTRGDDLLVGVLPNDATRTTAEEVETWIRLGRDANTDEADNNIGDELPPEESEPIVDTSLQGSSATNAFTGTENATADQLLFALTTFGDTFTINEHYYGSDSTGELASRVSDGAPTSFSTDARKDLIEDGGEEQQIFEQQVSGTLGTAEPVYVEGPDGAVVEFTALDGATFNTLVLNPRVNGNLNLPTRFDLYLWDGTGWQFDRLVTDADPNQLQVDGNVNVAFDSPVDRFRLYSHAVRNSEVYDAENLARPDVTVATGFTMTAGSAAAPRIQRDVITARTDLVDFDPIRTDSPVYASDLTASVANYIVQRTNGVVAVTPSLNGIALSTQTFEIGSTERIRIEGHDHVSDTLTIVGDSVQTPTPIRFSGGFRTDSVVVAGSGIVIDMVDRSEQSTTPTLEEV